VARIGAAVRLSPATRLGPYEILTLIGSGGMGDLYRARDTKLGRDVALKLLPESFTHDPERVARFRREAQVLASLNHPHIGAIWSRRCPNRFVACNKNLWQNQLIKETPEVSSLFSDSERYSCPVVPWVALRRRARVRSIPAA
jgi:serine/threonine protein kinase